MFDRFPEPVGDALHAVMARYRADPRPDKRDLGVGVYRDETGASPIMRAVSSAPSVTSAARTDPPSAANSKAAARPIPLSPPVISARLPWSLPDPR